MFQLSGFYCSLHAAVCCWGWQFATALEPSAASFQGHLFPPMNMEVDKSLLEDQQPVYRVLFEIQS